VYGCVRECDFDSMADMVSYGDRVYCVACCDKIHVTYNLVIPFEVYENHDDGQAWSKRSSEKDIICYPHMNMPSEYFMLTNSIRLQ